MRIDVLHKFPHFLLTTCVQLSYKPSVLSIYRPMYIKIKNQNNNNSNNDNNINNNNNNNINNNNNSK